MLTAWTYQDSTEHCRGYCPPATCSLQQAAVADSECTLWENHFLKWLKLPRSSAPPRCCGKKKARYWLPTTALIPIYEADHCARIFALFITGPSPGFASQQHRINPAQIERGTSTSSHAQLEYSYDEPVLKDRGTDERQTYSHVWMQVSRNVNLKM